MSDVSARLDLPFIAPSQAQKHVTHNEAVQRLDLLVQMALDGFEATEPPTAPETGARYALGQGAMGAWAGQDGQIAVFLGEAWTFVAPQEGWIATARGTADLRLYQEGAWQRFPKRIERLGIATDADALNRLSVAAGATLLSHAGEGHQLKINKATAAATASLLFQTGFSGRAEMGIAGQDDFSIKVSADGATWTEALRINAQTGHLGGAGVQSSPTDATAGRVLLTGAGGLLASIPPSVTDLNDAALAGFYNYAGAAANKPFSQGGAVLVISTNASRTLQLAYEHSSGRTAIRYVSDAPPASGSWHQWREIYHQNSVLGAVSQSDGVPTGAVIERGSNANGEYVRFADGTQICTRQITLGAPNVADGAGFSGATSTNWTYPAGFAPGITPAIGGACTNVGKVWVSSFVASNTAASLIAERFTPVATAPVSNVFAIGRWF